EIAYRCQPAPSRQGMPLDLCNHDLLQRIDLEIQLLQMRGVRKILLKRKLLQLPEILEVGARTKRLTPGPQHDDLRIVILLSARKDFLEFRDHLKAQGVAFFGTVEGNVAYAILSLILNVFHRLGLSLQGLG